MASMHIHITDVNENLDIWPLYNVYRFSLTHLPDKMAANLADNTFKYIFLNENDRILKFAEICSHESNWQ